jgi:hypothetical protein
LVTFIPNVIPPNSTGEKLYRVKETNYHLAPVFRRLVTTQRLMI